MNGPQIAAAHIAVGVDPSGVDAGLGQVEGAVRRAGRTLDTLGQQGTTALNDIGASSVAASRSLTAAERSMVASLQRQEAALRSGATSGSRYAAEMASLRGLDLSGPVGNAINSLRALEASQTRVGVSAAQTAAAMRGVPAQITDIVTSLQGGQAPLTVLFQQGGQLRDMFGSAGGAARALGSAVVGMINPFTIAAAAVAAGAIAYNQGSKEADAYRKAIIMTGNAAGVTAGQLAAMAKQASASGGTQGASAEALAALVGTGKVGAEELVAASRAAVDAQKYLGIAVGDTAKAYAALGKDPLKATMQLDEQYNYLTASTYEQIKALTDQGKKTEAAKVAQEAYGKAQVEMADKAKAALGPYEKAWSNLGGVAKKAWDNMLNIGREDTLDEKIAAAQKKLEQAQLAYYSFSGGSTKDKDADKEEAQRQLDRLKNQKKVAEMTAQYAAEDTKRKDAAIKLSQDGIKYLSQEAKIKMEIAEAETLVRESAKRGETADVTEKRIQDRIKEIRASYADYYNQSIESQIAAVTRLSAAQEEQAKRAFLPYEARNDAGLNTALDSQANYIKLVSKANADALTRDKDSLQQRLALVAKETVSVDGQVAHQEKLRDLKAQIALKDQQALTNRAQLEKDLFVLDVKNTQAAIASQNALYDSRLNDLSALDQQLQAQKDQNATIGMSVKQLGAFNTQLVNEQATRLEGKASILDTIMGREEEAEVLRKTAERMRELNTAQLEGAAKSFDYEKNKAMWESIDKTAHDTFVSIFDSGKSAFDRLRDTLKNGLLDMLYQMTIKKWIFNIGAAVTGSGGIAGVAQAATGASGAPGVIGAASTAIGTYNMFAGAGSAIAAAGNAFGSSAVSAFGAGLANTAGIGMTASEGFAAAGMATEATAAAAGSAISSAFMTALPWAAAAAGAHIIWNKFFENGPEANTRLKFSSNNTAGNISINERGNEGKVSDAYIAGSTKSSFGTFGVSSTFWAPAESETVQNFIKTVGKADDALASLLTTTEKASVSAYLTGKDITANVGAEGNIAQSGAELSKVFADRINNILEGVSTGLSGLVKDFEGTSQELATEAAALLEYRVALKDSGEAVFGAKVTLNELAALKAPTELVSVALKRVTNEFTATNAVATMLGKTAVEAFGAIGLASLSVREQLIQASGGLTTFSAQASSFAQNYYTEAERLVPVGKAVAESLASMGLASVDTREEFRATVEGLDLTTEAGAKQYASLLALADAFAAVYPAIEATTAAARSAADILAERVDLQNQLDKLTMTSTQLLDKQRAALDESNRSLFDQVQAATAAKSAAEAAATAAKEQSDAAAAAVKAVIDAATAAAEKSAAAMQSIGNSLASGMTSAENAAKAFRSLNDTLLTGDSSTLGAVQKYAIAKRQFETADQNQLQSAETSLLAASKAANGENSIAYARDFAAVIARNNKEANKLDAYAASIPEFWKLLVSSGAIGAHANGGIASGWSLVGENGPEIAQFSSPARIYTANQTREMMGGSSGASDEAIRENTAVLRQVLTATQENTKHARKTADIWTRVTRDGNSLNTTVT